MRRAIKESRALTVREADSRKFGRLEMRSSPPAWAPRLLLRQGAQERRGH